MIASNAAERGAPDPESRIHMLVTISRRVRSNTNEVGTVRGGQQCASRAILNLSRAVPCVSFQLIVRRRVQRLAETREGKIHTCQPKVPRPDSLHICICSPPRPSNARFDDRKRCTYSVQRVVLYMTRQHHVPQATLTRT